MNNQKEIEILNIPGYTPSYYVLGLAQSGYKLVVKPDPKFAKYNYATSLILRINGKLVVIDNDDPHGVIEDLYAQADYYYMTNKDSEKTEFQRDNIFPLFPHYPVNSLPVYLRLFFKQMLISKKIKRALVVLYTVYTRPKYVNYPLRKSIVKYVFFVARIWQKEKLANAWRIAFMEACTKISGLKFEGGFRTRKDETYPKGLEQYVNERTYNPPEFSRKTRESMVVFNNPAVKNAISWRLAEYLNAGKAIISVPFKMELPVALQRDQEVLYVNEPSQLVAAVKELVENDSKRALLESKAKAYFNTYCTPKAQILDIVEKC